MAVGRKSTLLAQGRPRTLGGGQLPWHVRLYAPDSGQTSYQVMFKAPVGEGEPWKRVLRRAASQTEARKIFAQAEAQWTPSERHLRRRTCISNDQRAGSRIPEGQPPARYSLARSNGGSHAPTRTSCPRLAKCPLRSGVLSTAATSWPRGARQSSPCVAVRTFAGSSWPCARSPGASVGWTAPSTHSMDRRSNVTPCLFGTKIRVAGFGGLRLGEQNDFGRSTSFSIADTSTLTGCWVTPRHAPGRRGPVKNRILHEVALPRSLMHDELLPRVKSLLGLPSKASLQQVIDAQETERRRR